MKCLEIIELRAAGNRRELLASQYAQRWIYVNLITEVASTYFAYLDFKQRHDISVRTLASRQESLRIIGARFEKGIALADPTKSGSVFA